MSDEIASSLLFEDFNDLTSSENRSLTLLLSEDELAPLVSEDCSDLSKSENIAFCPFVSAVVPPVLVASVLPFDGGGLNCIIF